jgi:hypothetical protein
MLKISAKGFAIWCGVAGVDVLDHPINTVAIIDLIFPQQNHVAIDMIDIGHI